MKILTIQALAYTHSAVKVRFENRECELCGEELLEMVRQKLTAAAPMVAVVLHSAPVVVDERLAEDLGN